MSPATTLRAPDGRTLSEQVAGELRDAIRSGRLAPGDRLVERKLAAEMGISHIPVREALARLADEGLVEHLPRRGARVAALDEAALDELSSLRIVLEQFVVERAQQRLTPALERELTRLVAQMRSAAGRRDLDHVFELDQRFHARLWAAADHRLLNELAGQLRGRLDGFLRSATLTLEPEQLEQHLADHESLLAAIASGNPAVAREAMRAHIETAAERLRRALPGA